jgi:cAMP-dependent protein kinase regulator
MRPLTHGAGVVQEPAPEPEDGVSAMPVFTRAKINRGGGIISSVMEGDKPRGAYRRQVVSKSAEEEAVIFAAFRAKPLFAKLDRDQLTEVCAIMQKSSYAAGQPLMSEGENGDTFFVLVEGTASVTMGTKFVRDLGPGDSFGEIALIYNNPRTSTIQATSTCVAFTLNREAYRNEVVASIKRQRQAWEAFLNDVPLFAALTPSQRAKTADALTPIRYAADERIITQGDAGDMFYIIEAGGAVITEDGSAKRLEFPAGKFFGEIALIQNVPRTAHVHAGPEGARCLTLDRAAFGRLFGQQVVERLSGENEMVRADVSCPPARSWCCTRQFFPSSLPMWRVFGSRQ